MQGHTNLFQSLLLLQLPEELYEHHLDHPHGLDRIVRIQCVRTIVAT